MHLTGDTGGYLRKAMAALALFGVPPEEHWPYVVAQFDDEPPAFCYSYASNYKALRYFRLDPTGFSGQQLVDRIKLFLRYRIPSMFGFTVYDSIWDAENGNIPFPASSESVQGGHAIVAVGYDNDKVVKHPYANGEDSRGAFIIRNSWGTDWGDAGYGYLPYDYVLYGLADDWWSVLKSAWVDTGQFGD
jgi:C1A family cysteine protease